MFAYTTWVVANIAPWSSPERTSPFFGNDESVHVHDREFPSNLFCGLSDASRVYSLYSNPGVALRVLMYRYVKQ